MVKCWHPFTCILKKNHTQKKHNGQYMKSVYHNGTIFFSKSNQFYLINLLNKLKLDQQKKRKRKRRPELNQNLNDNEKEKKI